jgi:hypothetical protein
MIISGILHHCTGYLNAKVRFIYRARRNLEQVHDIAQMRSLLGAATFRHYQAGKWMGAKYRYRNLPAQPARYCVMFISQHHAEKV